jgi:hypothetical protein
MPSLDAGREATCSCGQLRVRVRGEPLRISICHCRACQRRTGSVFGMQARFAREGATFAGSSTTWERTGDSGGTATFHFCSTCGAIAWWVFKGSPDVVAVPVGAFADPAFPAPRVSVYEECMHPWLRLPDGIEHHD